VSMLDTGFRKCEHNVPNGHVFEVSKVRFMLVSCDMVTSFGWLSTSEVDWGCVEGHNTVHEGGLARGSPAIGSSPS
jgi:hypothetical protein